MSFVGCQIFKKKLHSGFTLIELIVVLAVLGTVLFITLPKFSTLTFSKDSERQLNILVNTIRELKKKAVTDGTDYTLHLDLSKSVIWVTSDSSVPEYISRQSELMSKSRVNISGLSENSRLKELNQIEQLEQINKEAKEKATPLPESVFITGVEIYGLSNNQIQEEYRIRFSSLGYCDMALIHLKERETGEDLTVIIQPFILSVEIKKQHISFVECA